MDELLTTQSNRPNRQSGKGEEFDLRDIVRLFLRHKFLLCVLVLSAMSAAVAEHVLFPSYTVGAALYIQNSENPLQAVSARITGMTSYSDGMPKEIPEKYFQQLRSFDFYLESAHALKTSKEFASINKNIFTQVRAIDRWRAWKRKLFLPKAHPEEREDLSEEKIASRLAGWFSVAKNGPDSLRLTVTTSDPDLSLLLANLMADIAAKFISEGELKELNDAEHFISLQLEDTEKSIHELDQGIAEVKKDNKFLSFEGSGTEGKSQGGDLNKELEQANIEYDENERLIHDLTKEANRQKQASEESIVGPKPKYGLARKIDELKRTNQYLAVRRATLKKALEVAMGNVDPHLEQRVFDLRKKMELEYSLFQELKKQMFQIEMQRIVVKNKIRSLERARDFEIQRSLSLKKKLMFAVFIALLLGLPGSYAWELLTPTVKGRSDLEELNLIFLGGVPDVNSPMMKKHPVYFLKKTMPDSSVMCRFDIDSPASMSFKHIRTRILHAVTAEGKTPQVIALLSSQMGEGKSFTTRNLGSCFAHMQKKVLVIDCDLRKGSTSEFFKTRHMPGLGEVLSQTEKFGSVVKRAVLPGLDLLPAGTIKGGSTEVIASERFTELLGDLKSLYDYIFLDTPPLLPPPDAALIAKQAEMIIVVASLNTTRKEILDKSMDCLVDLNPGKRAYAILNKVNDVHSYVYVVPSEIIKNDRTKDKTKVPIA